MDDGNVAGDVLGFIGLGVMGAPMCRHLARKGGARVVAYDLASEPLERLAAHGVERAASVREVAEAASTVFLSLPSGRHVEAVCRGADGLEAAAVAGRTPIGTIVDLSTSPLALTRELGAAFAGRGVDYADAPVARTWQAAEQGTLAITVGATPEVFARIEPYLRCFASEVTHCGEVGAGQVAKILNNMVVVGTVVALSEAAAIARSVGMDATALFETLAKGSADSFALRNHGLKAVAPAAFPERVFSTEYMLKDVGYALEMAAAGGLDAAAARHGADLLRRAAEQGHGAQYWPVISTLIGSGEAGTPG